MLRFRATRAGGGPSISSAVAGNIGTDLMIKVLRLSDTLETAAMEGIDPGSDGMPDAAVTGVDDARRVHGLI